MAFYDKFPYTNFQELNLDQIVHKIGDLERAKESATDAAEQAKASETAAAGSAANASESKTAAAESAESVTASAQQISANTTQITQLASDVLRQSSQLFTASEQIAENRARIDTILASGTPTEGNAELIDIRTGANGVTYSTAGDAVRGQYTQLKNEFDNADLRTIDDYERHIGNINNSGQWNNLTNPNYKYFIFDVTANQQIILRASSYVRVAFLRSYTTPVVNDYANFSAQEGFTTWIAVTANTRTVLEAPSDAPFFFVEDTYNGNTATWYEFSVDTFNYVYSFIENMKSDQILRYRGDVTGTTFESNNRSGFYSFPITKIADLTDAPVDLANGGVLKVEYPAASNVRFQTIQDTRGNMWFRYGSNPFRKILNAYAVPEVRYIALGDSLTQGFTSAEGEIGPVTGWTIPFSIGRYNGYITTNAGVGGAGYLHHGTVDDYTNAKEKVDLIDFSDYDLVTLAFGVNDWHYQEQIGTASDNPSAGNTMASNMKYCIEKILTDNPLIKIFILAPVNCFKYGGTAATKWALNYSLPTSGTLGHVIDVIKEIAADYGIEVIEQAAGGIVNNFNIQDCLSDGIHPTEDCYKKMGKDLAGKITYR